MGRRILNDALRTMVNAERRGKATANLQPISTTMISFLNIMKNRGYIKDFEVFDPHRVGRITVQLQGRINDAKALTFRQDLKARYIEEYRTRTLPTRQFLMRIAGKAQHLVYYNEFSSTNSSKNVRLNVEIAAHAGLETVF